MNYLKKTWEELGVEDELERLHDIKTEIRVCYRIASETGDNSLLEKAIQKLYSIAFIRIFEKFDVSIPFPPINLGESAISLQTKLELLKDIDKKLSEARGDKGEDNMPKDKDTIIKLEEERLKVIKESVL